MPAQQILDAEWDAPDDPDNPWNWPLWRKLYASFMPVAIGFLCPFSSSVYTPGREDVVEKLHTSSEVALLPFSLFLLGLSLGPLIAGPASERFGRKPVYLIALPLFAAFTIGAGFSQTVAQLTVLRFLAGLFSSPGLSIGTGSLADVWSPDTRSIPVATYLVSVQSGASMGPFIGGFVAERKGWRWTQWTILFLLAFTLTGSVFMKETYKTKIIQARAIKRAKQSDAERSASEEAEDLEKILTKDERPLQQKVQEFLRGTVYRPMHMMATEPIVGLYDLYIGLVMGILNCFIAAFPNVFRAQYNFNLGAVGLTFLSQVVGNLFGWGFIVGYAKLYYEPLSRRVKVEGGGRPAPEKRLYIALLGAPMVPISLFWFGWTARPEISWAVPVVAEAMFACGNLLIFSAASLYFVDCYGARYGASAWSSNVFARYLLSAIFPLFSDQMYAGLGVGWASSLLGFVTSALVLIPVLFLLHGRKLRRKSRYSGEQ